MVLSFGRIPRPSWYPVGDRWSYRFLCAERHLELADRKAHDDSTARPKRLRHGLAARIFIGVRGRSCRRTGLCLGPSADQNTPHIKRLYSKLLRPAGRTKKGEPQFAF